MDSKSSGAVGLLRIDENVRSWSHLHRLLGPLAGTRAQDPLGPPKPRLGSRAHAKFAKREDLPERRSHHFAGNLPLTSKTDF